MIYSLYGIVKFCGKDFFVIDCSGVGYKLICSKKSLEVIELGQKIEVFTYLILRENSINLFGFLDYENLEFFKLLITVSGIGPRCALGLLSKFSPQKISYFVNTGNSQELTCAPGVGPKTAKRIVLELKDKINSEFIDSKTGKNMIEASGALTSLGYSQAEISKVLEQLDISLSTELIIKQALKLFSLRNKKK
ncbi:MAG: Holliday junction branch migration protein RuvA [Oscillospiraceae bacterium]|nr:Holliday junction branch migration protein RuvA [Oscillospiraceae bacterium]